MHSLDGRDDGTIENHGESDLLDDLRALVGLTALRGMGPRRLRAVLDEWTPTGAWEALARGRLRLHNDVSATFGGQLGIWLQRWEQQAAGLDAGALLDTCSRRGITILSPGSPAYPGRLRHDPDAPALLYAMGDLQLLDVDTVAIVGTRTASAYGLDVAFELGAALADSGIAVVSGLAAGIDGSAHRGALSGASGCGPIGVVGSGLDVVYPRSHKGLWQRVSERGLLLSEAPPGVAPEPWRFPSRNRIIAGLSRAVVVVESPEQGGSMITADEALNREIPVLAVPGSVHSPVSVGPHRLLFDGCGPARGPDDVLGALGRFPSTPEATITGRRRQRPSAPDGDDGQRSPGGIDAGGHGHGGRRGKSGRDVTPPLDPGARRRHERLAARSAPRRLQPEVPPRLEPAQQKVLDALGWQPASLDELIERSGLAFGRVALLVEELHQRGLVQRELGFIRRI